MENSNGRLMLEALRLSCTGSTVPELRFVDDSSRNFLHRHRFWELVLSLGRDGKRFDRVGIVPPGTSHRKLSLAEFKRSALIGIKAGWLSVSFRSRHVVGIDTALDELELLSEHLEQIERWRLLHPASTLPELHVRPLLAELETALRRALSTESDQPCASVCEIAVNYISTNYPRRDLSAAEVARHVGVCGDQLTRLFRANRGETVRGCIIAVRMLEACQLLGEKGLTVSHAAEMTGWRNHTYFSRAFRRTFGVCPSEFVERCRSGISWHELIADLAPKLYDVYYSGAIGFLTKMIR